MNNNITVNIDGRTVSVKNGITVLKAAQKAGIYIPTLCNLESVPPFGSCRLCIVEIKNIKGFPASCATPVTPGMEISTNTPELQSLRKGILELKLSEHPYACLICKDKDDCGDYMHTTRKAGVATGCNFCNKNGKCELQTLVEYIDLKEIRFPIEYRNLPPVRNNPLYDIDYNLCILCGRCVRICSDERNSNVLEFVQRGKLSIIGTAFEETLKEAGCEYCGACVDVCPTGSISEKIGKWAGLPDKKGKTTCIFCSVGCQMNINIKGKRIVNIGPPIDDRSDPPQLCIRGKFVPMDITHHPKRITTPLIKKNRKWIEVTWEEAINFTAENLEHYKDHQFGIIGSPHSSLEDNYILQKFARKVMKSNNIDHYPSLPEKSIIKNIYDFYSASAPIELNKIQNYETILLLNTQAYISHPIIENRIRKAYKNGKEVIAVQTHYNRTTEFSSQNIIINPGEESLFLTLLFNKLINSSKGKINVKKEVLDSYKIDELKSENDIVKIAKTLNKSKKTLIIIGECFLKDQNGLNNINSLINIKLALNKPENCDIIFLTDDGNKLGSSLVGMNPYYLPGFSSLSNKSDVKTWSENWKTNLTNNQGLSLNEMFDNISNKGISALYINGDIPVHDNLKKIKFLVQQNMFLTEISEYTNVFFPLTSFVETKGHIINFEGKLKNINPTIPSAENTKSSWEILSLLSKSMSEEGFSYKNTKEIFSEINEFTNISFNKSGQEITEMLLIEIKSFTNNSKYPFKVIIEPNHFHYLGNDLTELITDLKEVLDQDILFISPQTASKLKVKNEHLVEISTQISKSQIFVRVNHDFEGETCYLKPGRKVISQLLKGINCNKSFIYAKIVKV